MPACSYDKIKMKCSTIVPMALCGYVQSAQLTAKTLAEDEPRPFGKFGGADGAGSKLDGKFDGKGLIYSAEAGANSEQGQSVKILPDTHTLT